MSDIAAEASMDGPVYDVPVADIVALVDPLRRNPWRGVDRVVREEEVREAVARGDLRDAHLGEGLYEDHKDRMTADEARALARREHVARIAWFVVHGVDAPVEIDVGIPSVGFFVGGIVLDDGHHRLAAAAIRGDATIPVCPSGECDHFTCLFPNASEVTVPAPAPAP